MIRTMPIVAMTLRSLLDRRRFWLMLLLAAVPVLLALLVSMASEEELGSSIFDGLMLLAIVPLIALVFGTGALGAEIEDGTIVYLLTKPIRRSRIVLSKSLVAAGLTAALVAPSTFLTGLVASLDMEATLAWVIAITVGGTAYALAFMTLSSFTSRALVIGIGYVLLWEGVLSNLLPGAGMLSINQATQGLASELQGIEASGAIGGTAAAVVLIVVISGALALTTWRMSRYQLRGGD